MDRDALKAWIDEGLSLAAIGAKVGRDPSTVGYWCKRYGLEPNGRARYAPRGGIDTDQLVPLIERGMTLAQIAGELDRSISTVQYWLRRHGLRTTAYGRHRKRALAALERGETSFISTCTHHGETRFLVFPSGVSRCAACNVMHVTERRRRSKATLVAEHGGRCVLCEYDRCLAALQFHHVDPRTKAFSLSNAGITCALELSREEARKCVLLCANCHAEVEAGAASLP